MFKKLDLGNYQWLNYNQVHASTLSFGAGLRSLGVEPKSIIAIYAETRAEWMMSSLSPFKQAFEEQSMCDKMEEFFSVFGKLKNHEGIVRLCENAVLPNVNDIAKLLTTANDLLQKHSAGMFKIQNEKSF